MSDLHIFANTSTHDWLVGGLNPSEKYESVGMIIPNLWKFIKVMFQSPPTRLGCIPMISIQSEWVSSQAAPQISTSSTDATAPRRSLCPRESPNRSRPRAPIERGGHFMGISHVFTWKNNINKWEVENQQSWALASSPSWLWQFKHHDFNIFKQQMILWRALL